MPSVLLESAINLNEQAIDFIITDPPYYDAIGYSVLMDFFYVWLRRSLDGLNDESLQAFYQPLTPKWDHKEDNGELVDDANRFGGDKNKSRLVYENGMFHAFLACNKALQTDGRLVVVFANKQPEAWEALVSALIRANFVVNGSWPIQTEMSNRTRAHAGAALASSVWLVCKKRPETSRPGWDNRVLEEMHLNIAARLRDFWDAGIRGPDFVWAATGPALEAYSQYPVVKKTNHPGEVMGVSEFLTHVRRIVVDFVVGRVLSGSGEQESSGLDSISTYYLLHRHDFGLQEAPAGACILYAISCGLSDRDLADRYQILTASGKVKSPEDLDENFDEDSEEAYEESSKSTMRLKGWKERKRYLLKGDGEGVAPSRLPLFPDLEAAVPESRAVPLVDHVHRLMHLWKGGDVNRVNDYLDGHGLRRNQLSHQVLQALIELAPANSEERSLLESISNHVGAKALNAQRLF